LKLESDPEPEKLSEHGAWSPGSLLTPDWTPISHRSVDLIYFPFPGFVWP